MQTITATDLAFTFKDAKEHQNVKFCFLLGAGSSLTSGIPLGDKLAKKWFGEIKERAKQEDFDQWIQDTNISEKDLASSYSTIYEKRFKSCAANGYAEIEKLFRDAEPSVGYAYFAKLLIEQISKFVITTNFDTLIEDALFTYTKTRPLVCGHESLANFVNMHTDRPTIIKVHRDILLNPISDIDGTSALNSAWDSALRPLLSNTHLVVIGYNGNDGSLMGYLKSIKSARKPIYWCVRDEGKIKQEIKDVLQKGDYIVKIDGFDELIFEICDKLEIKIESGDGDINKSEIVQNAIARAREFNEQLNALGNRTKNNAKEITQYIKNILPDWWSYELEVENANTNEEKEQIYQDGLKAHPNSHELIGNYALFLHEIKKDYDNAEKFYKKALELEPNDAYYNGNYANFLFKIKKDYDNAEKYYKKALELEPNHANNNSNYAVFLNDIKKDYDNAERHYKKALELEPNGANYNGNYANFLNDIKKDYDNAEKYYKKALELEPNHANNNGNYAGFLLARGHTKEAQQYLNKAFELCDNDGLLSELWFYTLAHFPNKNTTAKQELDNLLAKGVRSIGWDFAPNIEQAKKDGNQNIKELEEYARRITTP